MKTPVVMIVQTDASKTGWAKVSQGLKSEGGGDGGRSLKIIESS